MLFISYSPLIGGNLRAWNSLVACLGFHLRFICVQISTGGRLKFRLHHNLRSICFLRVRFYCRQRTFLRLVFVSRYWTPSSRHGTLPRCLTWSRQIPRWLWRRAIRKGRDTEEGERNIPPIRKRLWRPLVGIACGPVPWDSRKGHMGLGGASSRRDRYTGYAIAVRRESYIVYIRGYGA